MAKLPPTPLPYRRHGGIRPWGKSSVAPGRFVNGARRAANIGRRGRKAKNEAKACKKHAKSAQIARNTTTLALGRDTQTGVYGSVNAVFLTEPVSLSTQLIVRKSVLSPRPELPRVTFRRQGRGSPCVANRSPGKQQSVCPVQLRRPYTLYSNILSFLSSLSFLGSTKGDKGVTMYWVSFLLSHLVTAPNTRPLSRPLSVSVPGRRPLLWRV